MIVDREETPSSAIERISKALHAVHKCCKRQEDYLNNLELFCNNLRRNYPIEFEITKTATALQTTGIQWESLPWPSILQYLDPLTLVRLRRLSSSANWSKLLEHAICWLPIVIQVHNDAKLPVQRLVGQCTGEYHLIHSSHFRKYSLQNGKIGKNRVFLFLHGRRWSIGALCGLCRSKSAKTVCSQCAKKYIATATMMTTRFPPYNLEWTVRKLLNIGHALNVKSIVAAVDHQPLSVQSKLVEGVQLSNCPRYCNTLNGTFLKHEVCSFNGLPVFYHCDGTTLVLHGRGNDSQENCSAMIFRDRAGFWNVQMGSANADSAHKFIRSTRNVVVLRTRNCGNLFPCKTTSAIEASTLEWMENLQNRPNAAQNMEEVWVPAPKIKCLRGAFSHPVQVRVRGQKIRGSEFEGDYTLERWHVFRVLCLLACVDRSYHG